jgi:O-antigen/teichoic acid export membrane protein
MWSRLKQIIKVIISKPPDPFTPQGRSQDRYRRAALTSLVMVTARVSNILTGILTVPITLKYLGEDLFGMWMVLTSVVGFLSFYDFGIGIGLRNLLIECMGNDDHETPRELIGNALLILIGLAMFMILLVYTLLPLLPISELIKCKNPASIPQILPTTQAVLVMFAAGLPITQLQNIANAYQRGYWGYLCFLIGRILGFLFVVWCVHAKQPLWILAGGFVGIPFAITLIGWIVFFFAAPAMRPWPVSPNRMLIRRLFGTGIYVLIHHISYALINTSAMVLIANTINAASATPYSVTQRMLGVSTVLTASLLLGISVPMGEAWHRREIDWVRRTLRRSELLVLLLGILPLVPFLFVGQAIILWWTKCPQSVPSFNLLIACVLLTCGTAICNIYGNCLMAMNDVRFLAISKFAAGVLVILSGYAAGLWYHSPSLITWMQFFFGTLVPGLLLWAKINRMIAPSRTPGPFANCPAIAK